MTDKEKKIRDDLMKHGLRLRYGYSIVKRKTKSKKKKASVSKPNVKENYSHYLENEAGKKIKLFEKFNRQQIQKIIISFLAKNKKSEVYLYKREQKGYDTFINAYKNHPKTGEACLIVTKGNKEYLKSIK